MEIPFFSFSEMNKQIKAEVLSAFEIFFSGSSYILGENVRNFEGTYAAFNEVQHCIGVSNGLDALFLALKSLHIGAGDEVIIPSHTYIATMLAVAHTGAKPVLVEPCNETYNLDPAKIEAAVTEKTKAVIPVHLYGQSCRMDEIMRIAQRHKLFVVEDNAQSQGAKFNGRPTGSWGHVNATSFYPAKNLGALGDAGALTTDDEELAKRLRILRNYGSEKKYYNEEAGYNMRMDECQAAFLSVKLKYLETWTKQRQELAAMYDKALGEIDELTTPLIGAKSSHVYHLYVVRCKHRDLLQAHLNKKGIGTLIHYPVPIHLQPAYAKLGYTKSAFPIAEQIASTCLSLPLWPGMQQDQVNYVCSATKEFLVKKIFAFSINLDRGSND